MTTPTGPEHDPIEGPVRALLWRLRARLVTPPDEQHARSDLDRIVAAAREQAHSAPSPGASSCPPVVADAGTPVFVTSAGHDELAARRRKVGIPHLGRIAAAALVVVATVSGVAGARDGSVTLNTLLGRQSSEAPELAAPDVVDNDTDVVASELPEIADEPSPEPTDDGAVDEGEPEPAAEPDQAGSDDAGTPDTDADRSDTSGTSDSGEQSSGSGEATDDSSGEAREDESDDESDSDDDADSSDDPTNEVIAAPETPSNDGVDGMGGRAGCEGEVADCVEADDDAAEDLADKAEEAEKAAKERDELANRRFQPSDDDGEDDDPQES